MAAGARWVVPAAGIPKGQGQPASGRLYHFRAAAPAAVEASGIIIAGHPESDVAAGPPVTIAPTSRLGK
ncbi:hypothetical protein EN842_08720 [bacterium M00.F.Ca.ET.199.01.1.1]|nr:hypothetical protein EN842_08720 [bacterium M00.F.Ca.ET.199.01.1.1]